MPPSPISTTAAWTHVAIFLFGGLAILIGLSSKDSVLCLPIGFGIVLFTLRVDLWNALRDMREREGQS
jgi:hypothetical protein